MAAAGEAKSLAAVVFAEGEDVNRLMNEFCADLASAGHRVAGCMQILLPGPDGREEAHVRDIETGEIWPIFQNLGKFAQSCRVDPAAVGEVGRLVRNALERRPDLLVVNRFGKLESEGKGILDEIALAATSGIPVLLGVAWRYRENWRRFAMGLDAELACSRAALDEWWRCQASASCCAMPL